LWATAIAGVGAELGVLRGAGVWAATLSPSATAIIIGAASRAPVVFIIRWTLNR
jgi:hypothetical protein